MSDTPRTDEQRNRCIMSDCAVDFARQLERDLTILIEAIDNSCEIPEGIRQALLKVRPLT